MFTWGPNGAITEVASAWSTSASPGSSWSFSNGDRTATVSSGSGVREVVGTLGRSTGKRYFEIVKTTSGTFGTGVRDEYGFSLLAFAGNTAADGASFRRGGAIFQGATNVLAVAALADGDVVSVALDLGTGNYWFGRNGTWVQGDPATATSPVGTVSTGVSYYPGASSETPSPCVVTLNSSYSQFVYAPPSGFLSWAES